MDPSSHLLLRLLFELLRRQDLPQPLTPVCHTLTEERDGLIHFTQLVNNLSQVRQSQQ